VKVKGACSTTVVSLGKLPSDYVGGAVVDDVKSGGACDNMSKGGHRRPRC
jgi:hypothetical protein